MSAAHVPDDASANPHQPEVSGPAPRAQWLGLLLAPAVFATHLQVNYLLVLWVCGNDVGALPIHLASVVAVALSGLGAWIAWTAWRKAGAHTPSEGDGVLPRTRLLGTLGVGLSALLTLILLAQFVSGFVPPLCQ